MKTLRLVKNTTRMSEIRQALKENDGYCPCAIQKTPDTRCICKQFREQLARGEEGVCHCGLHVYGEAAK